jgi:hypothetical protein
MPGPKSRVRQEGWGELVIILKEALMLSPMAAKFVTELGLKITEDQGGQHLPKEMSIRYGSISARINKETGIKARNATLFLYGKPIAEYYADSDEIRATGVLADLFDAAFA